MADGTIKIGMELDGSGLGAQADAAGKDAAGKAGASFSEVESKGTSAFAAVAKAGVAAFAAVGSAALAFGGMALSAYSNYEQLSGGVAKLYGSGQTLIAYAQEQGCFRGARRVQQIKSGSCVDEPECVEGVADCGNVCKSVHGAGYLVQCCAY